MLSSRVSEAIAQHPRRGRISFLLVILSEAKDLLLILKLLKPRSFGQKRPQDDKTITPASRDDKMLSSRVSEAIAKHPRRGGGISFLLSS